MNKVIRYIIILHLISFSFGLNAQNLTLFQAEYFWGTTDPGEGNGIPISAKDGNYDDVIEAVFATGVTPPSVGLNILNLRMRGLDGVWGTVFKTILHVDAPFSTNMHITQAEFYIDTDLGAGNNQAMLAVDGNFNDVIEGAIRTGISAPSPGLHIIGVRYKGLNGAWGPDFKMVFHVDTQFSANLNLVQAEYFFDTDPGEGSGFPLLASDGVFNASIEHVIASASIGGLTQGPHRLSARMKGSNGLWGPVFSIIVLVDPCVPSPSAIISANGPTAICAGDSVLLNANIGSGLSYQWQRDGVNISGATNNSYYAKQAGAYTVVVTNTGGCSAQSSGLVVTISGAATADISIASNPVGTVCPGTSVTFTASVLNGGVAPSYQWQINGVNTGTNSNIFISTGLNNGDVVRCILTPDQTCVLSDTSNGITMSIHALPTATVSANGSTTFCQGGNVTLSAPAGYTYLWNNNAVSSSITVNTSGSYSVIVTDANGCSATSAGTNVIVNQPVTSIVNQVACGSFTWVTGNGQTYASSTTATHTIPNGAANGCDSTVTLNLTINQSASSTINQTACGSFTWTNGNGQTYTSSTTATHTIPNGAANGCDSTITLNLTINQLAISTVHQTSCGSYTWTNGNGQTYTSSTTATHTIANGAANGCDSTVTLNLTINQPASSTINQTACGSFTWTNGNGQTYTSSTTATHTIPNGAANGCDSTVTLHLTITDVDNTVSQNGTILTANQPNASYQWIDCDSNLPIVGETNSSFTVVANGNYAAQITLNGCTETSSCVTVSGIGISENTWTEANIFPNPSSGIFTIQYGVKEGETRIEVYNSVGQLLFIRTHISSQEILDLTTVSSGIYFVKIVQKNTLVSVMKLIKR